LVWGIGVMGVWRDVPIGRLVRLVGVSPAALALALVPLPDDAPAVVTCRPHSEAATAAEVVGGVLDELERVVIDLFPAWLPEAEGISGPGGAGVAAVRGLAVRSALATARFGPFLADLAERALRRGAPHAGRFSAEVRAAGLARVLAATYRRQSAAVLLVVPDGLTGDAELALVGGCDWLAHRGGLGVWLVGPSFSTVDWLPTVRVRLPTAAPELDREPTPSSMREILPALSHPPLAGRPHPASTAEHALERALAPLPWAAGRAWNQIYHPHPLATPVRLDLLWPRERCVVEIDGPEHREPLRFEADRRRDVQLQLAGYVVLRFTNAQIAGDLERVVSDIERLVKARRLATVEGQHYAPQG
jgi:hypothetical protein